MVHKERSNKNITSKLMTKLHYKNTFIVVSIKTYFLILMRNNIFNSIDIIRQ